MCAEVLVCGKILALVKAVYIHLITPVTAASCKKIDIKDIMIYN